jgi:hypothetical protein
MPFVVLLGAQASLREDRVHTVPNRTRTAPVRPLEDYSLNWICRKLARSLDFSTSHVPREHNTEACAVRETRHAL